MECSRVSEATVAGLRHSAPKHNAHAPERAPHSQELGDLERGGAAHGLRLLLLLGRQALQQGRDNLVDLGVAPGEEGGEHGVASIGCGRRDGRAEHA